MKLIKDIKGDVALLTLKGEFDSFVCNPFIDQVDGLSDIGVKNIILNMRLVKFINSTAVGSIIKTRKKLQEKDGDLVISKPSGFVQEVIQNLGLASDVLTVFKEDQEALALFNAEEGIEMSEDNNILVHLPGETSAPLVGRIRKLEEDRTRFETQETEIPISSGSEVRLKFRLPLFRKSHYFDITAKITDMVHSSTGVSVAAEFTHIFEEDRKSIAQFVQDMQFLRKEARES
jgi:anti-anti-sigma factor